MLSFKEGGKGNPGNYRPVNPISMVVEGNLTDRTYLDLQRQGLIRDSHHGKLCLMSFLKR